MNLILKNHKKLPAFTASDPYKAIVAENSTCDTKTINNITHLLPIPFIFLQLVLTLKSSSFRQPQQQIPHFEPTLKIIQAKTRPSRKSSDKTSNRKVMLLTRIDNNHWISSGVHRCLYISVGEITGSLYTMCDISDWRPR